MSNNETRRPSPRSAHRHGMPACLTLAVLLCLAGTTPARAELDATTAAQLQAAISGEHRSAANRARDRYRKPFETLEFLGLRDDMTVVEIWPGWRRCDARR